MKLQSIKQLNNELANERKKQIDEGLYIAQKVDVLRQTLASLEAQHQKFLAGSREESDKVIAELDQKKSTLKNEISKLEERRIELLKPLNDKWDELEEQKQAHKLELADFEIRNDLLKTKEKEFSEKEKQLNQKQETLSNQEEVIKRVSRETQELNEQAKNLKNKQLEEYTLSTTELGELRKELEEKEKLLVIQANFNKHRENILNKREKELNNKDRAIKDKYETLMRTLSRINNK